jgi:hypothetical protein
MALQLEETEKGIVCNYWKIYRNDQNIVENKTCVRLALYKDRASRDLSIMNFLKLESFVFDGLDYTREQLYEKIIEPVNEEQDNPDFDSNQEESESNPRKITVQVNKFVNATDC